VREPDDSVDHGRIVASGTRSEVAPGGRGRSSRHAASTDAAGKPNPARAPGPGRSAIGDRHSPHAAKDHALPLVELDGASVWLGPRRVIRDLDWRIDRGQQWLVTGTNGSGKSTLLRMLHAQLRPALGGSIRWPALGNPRSVWTLRRRVAWVSPELQAAYRYPTTVRECVASGFDSSFGLTRAPTARENERIDELLAEFDLDALSARPLTTLSYGQARRALIARALVNRPQLLLLDEPWEGLDEDASAALNRALAATVAHGTQLVCASHLTAHRELFTHEIVLEPGGAARTGPIDV
jgi:molybdate transport system ATP-binding protein